MRRDASEFANFGITAADITKLENDLNIFSENVTDIEVLSDQVALTTMKDAKAEELRVAIRAVMTRVELQFGATSASYRKFGTENLSKQPDADLLITGKRVVRVGTQFLDALAARGLTPAMLTQMANLSTDFENAIIDMKIEIGDRDVRQEERVEMANTIYNTLVGYTNTGQSIWTTSNVAKYNDYVIYNTTTGDAPVADAVI
jgi:hypothetical protein